METAPLPLQLDEVLQNTQTWEDGRFKSVERDIVVEFIPSIKNTKPKTEAEFLGLNPNKAIKYLEQIKLFEHLLIQFLQIRY